MRDSPRRVFLNSTTQDRTSWDDLSRPVAALILDRVSGNLRSACLMSLIARIVRVRYVWLTPHKALVAGVTVGVAVFVCLTEVALKRFAVAET